MDNFQIGQIFNDTYPPEAAVWCNANNAYIEAIPDKKFEIKAVPPKTPEELAREELAKAKAERAEAVQNIAVEVDGMIFDGNEDAQRRISIALTTGNITGQKTVDWVLKNNTVATVTREQLEKVLALSMQAMQELWTKPYTE